MPRKILIVDDDPAHSMAVAAYFKTRGFDTAQARDAISAVTIAQQYAPELLILDFEMPAGNGITVYERLTNLKGYADLPAIFITGFEPFVRTMLPNKPHLRLLSKPVDLFQVLVQAHELLRLPAPPPLPPSQ